MTGPGTRGRRRLPSWATLVVSLAGLFGHSTLFAQIPQLSFEEVPATPSFSSRPTGLLAGWRHSLLHSEEESEPPDLPPPQPLVDPAVKPVSHELLPPTCADCGSGRLGLQLGVPPGEGCVGCGGPRPPCVPGQRPGCGACGPHCAASAWLGDHPAGRFFDCLYECICCPDPCYYPQWCPIADAAFYAAAPRPIAHMKIRWDSAFQIDLPDRAEFFWARQDGRGKGPRPLNGNLVASARVKYNDLTLYTEAGTGVVAAIVEMPYRSMDPDNYGHTAGFGDIKVGVKTLLFDCEMLQIAMQFLTYTPSGIASKGLGTGHVSLEPSLLFGVRLGPDTYLQHQLSEWIPLGGDPDYSGAVLHTHTSLNQVLLRLLPEVPLIGTMELNTWSFQDGAYTDPVLGFQRAGGFTYLSTGPGLRLFICDKVDFGFHFALAVRDPHFAAQQYRTEFRYRF